MLRGKSARYSPNGDYSRGDAQVPICRADPDDPTSPDGLIVCNIPLGSDEFVESYLTSKASKTCSEHEDGKDAARLA